MGGVPKPWRSYRPEKHRVDANAVPARGSQARSGRAIRYLAEQAGLDIAERFLLNAQASFNDLARQPMIGAPLTRTPTTS